METLTHFAPVRQTIFPSGGKSARHHRECGYNGDLNGITSIPREIAADVADASAELAANEHVILDALHSDSVSLATFKEAVAEADALMDALRRRVARKN